MLKRRDWFLVVSLVLMAWGLDQISKAWAVRSLTELKFFGPVGFVLHFNPGAILGTFSHLPPILRVVSLSTGGAFLIFIYGAIQYLLPSKSMALRCGMSLLLGGILGNVTDRIVIGEVVDFILLGSREMASPAFNLADAIQWIGYFLVVYGLIKDGSLFWPDVNVRKTVWVNPSFQLRYCMIMVAIGFCFAVVNGVFAFTFLKVTIDDLVVGPARMMEERFLIPFMQVYAVITVGFMLSLFVLGRILSHRTAGPIYAFEKFILENLDGKGRRLRLRKGDEFRDTFEELAEKLQPIIQDHKAEPSKKRA